MCYLFTLINNTMNIQMTSQYSSRLGMRVPEYFSLIDGLKKFHGTTFSNTWVKETEFLSRKRALFGTRIKSWHWNVIISRLLILLKSHVSYSYTHIHRMSFSEPDSIGYSNIHDFNPSLIISVWMANKGDSTLHFSQNYILHISLFSAGDLTPDSDGELGNLGR